LKFVAVAAVAGSAGLVVFVAIVDFAVMAASVITAGSAITIGVHATTTAIASGAMAGNIAANLTSFKSTPSAQAGGVFCVSIAGPLARWGSISGACLNWLEEQTMLESPV
jgi:hypothetical protein